MSAKVVDEDAPVSRSPTAQELKKFLKWREEGFRWDLGGHPPHVQDPESQGVLRPDGETKGGKGKEG